MFIEFSGFFLTGLAVNLTPCVYPLLTVTCAFFKPKEGETIGHSFSRALLYVFGMAVMYSSLGYFAASTGKLFGAALQNSWVLGIVALMMFGLGLSMLGFYELKVPHDLLARLNPLRKLDVLGYFFSGMLVGIFAAPCIGPPVLGLLAMVANNGDPKFGFMAFFIFSLGMGLPYLLLGTFSSLMTHLPKAGKWLIWIERLFGVVLIGFGIFYLALAMHWQIPKPGRVEFWQPYSEARFQKAVAEQKPVVIDFFAEWCFGCHELDINVFSRPEIQFKLKQVEALRVDATDLEEPMAAKLMEEYELIGLPTVIFLDRSGREVKEARVEGGVSLQDFESAMQTWAQEAGITFEGSQ